MSGPILAEGGDDLTGDLSVVASGSIDELHALHPPHPRQLAPGVGSVGALDGIDIPGEELLEAERGAGGPRRPMLRGGTSLLRGAGVDHLLDPDVDAPSQLVAIDPQPHQQGGAPKAGCPEPLAGARWLDARALQLGGPCDALAVTRVDRRRNVRVELAPQLLRPARGDLALDLGANLTGHGRTEIEVGERRPQVQPGP